MKKIESSELEKLKEIQSKLVNKYLDLGQLQYSIKTIETEIQKLYVETLKIKTEETNFKKELNLKYGDVEINIETGEFKI